MWRTTARVAASILGLSLSTSATAGFEADRRIEIEGGGERPVGVTIADLNGDGLPDIVTANQYSNNLTILLGRRGGGFVPAPGSPFAIDVVRPLSVLASDLDRDRHADLVVRARYASGPILLRGDGKGSFATRPGVPDFMGSFDTMAVADVNGDGRPDIVIAKSCIITVLLQSASGVFEQGPTVCTFEEPTPYIVSGLIVADLDGDGRQDIVLGAGGIGYCNSGRSLLVTLLGDGRGGFTRRSQIAADEGSSTKVLVVTADLDGDGRPEVVWAHGRRLAAFRVPGGSLGPALFDLDAADSAILDLGVGDLDGDGRPDLVALAPGSRSVTAYLGNGRGTFQPAPGSPFPLGALPLSLAVADMNGDGFADVVVAEASDALEILSGRRGGRLRPSETALATGAAPASVALGDWDGDGHLDVVTANAERGSLTRMAGDGTGHFARAGGLTPEGGAVAVALADLNADGHLDLVFGDAAGNLHTWLVNGNDAAAPLPGSPFALGARPSTIGTWAIDGDGRVGIVAACPQAGTVAVLLAGAKGSFGAAAGSPLWIGGRPISARVANLDRDGIPDLVVLDADAPAILVFRGLGEGRFQSAPTASYALRGDASALAVGDLDGDGWFDAVVALRDPSTPIGSRPRLLVLSGDANGGLHPNRFYPAPDLVADLAIEDLNGDGRADLVAASLTSALYVLLGNDIVPPPLTTIAFVRTYPDHVDSLQKISLYATIIAGDDWHLNDPAAGYVTFLDGATPLATAPLFNGFTYVDIGPLAPGTHALSVRYEGSPSFQPSVSKGVEVIVRAGP